MWQKSLAAAAALVVLSGSVQANTVTIKGTGNFSGGSISGDFLLTGDNTSPPDAPIMTLSASTPLMLPGFIAGLTTFLMTGSVSGPGISQVSPPNAGLLGGTNISGASPCNQGGCSPATFTAPTGQLDIPLTVSGALSIMGGGAAIPPTVPFTLSLTTTAPGLSLSEGAPNEIPLPATLPLFASGLGALGLLARRRKRLAPAVA